MPASRGQVLVPIFCHLINGTIQLLARILLYLADGLGIRPAARHLNVGLNTIRRWRDRFLTTGCAGIEHDAPGRGRKPVITAERKAEIVRMTTQEKPPWMKKPRSRLSTEASPGFR